MGYNVCRYCKKPGHLQKICNSRIKAGALEVDAQGIPYMHTNELDPEDGAEAAGSTLQHQNPWHQQQQQLFNWELLQEIYPMSPDFI